MKTETITTWTILTTTVERTTTMTKTMTFKFLTLKFESWHEGGQLQWSWSCPAFAPSRKHRTTSGAIVSEHHLVEAGWKSNWKRCVNLVQTSQEPILILKNTKVVLNSLTLFYFNFDHKITLALLKLKYAPHLCCACNALRPRGLVNEGVASDICFNVLLNLC